MFWDFQKEKCTFFQKCSKIVLVAKKLFRGGVSEPKVINITLFFYFLFNPSLNNQKEFRDYNNQQLLDRDNVTLMKKLEYIKSL